MMQVSDMPNYRKLLSDEEVMKYFYLERPWENDRIEAKMNEWVNLCKGGYPLGVLTVCGEKGNFMGYVRVTLEKEEIGQIVYAFLPEYWNRGIGQSVLKKMIEEWGPEVRRIGLGVGLDKNNDYHQKIKNKFRCFKGRELRQFYATAKPINIPSWHILEKVGFEPAKRGVENVDSPIDFNAKGFKLPSLDNLFDYYSKIEYYIEKLYQDKEIKVDKLYQMIDNNGKLYTFSRGSHGRIRFHYEREVD